MSALGKTAGEFTSTAVVVLFQNLICLVFVIPLAIRGGWTSLRTEKIGLHILRAASGTACWYALFFAIKMMPLTNAILLTFSAPLWMPVIAWVAFRQKSSAATWIGAAMVLCRYRARPRPAAQQFQRRRTVSAGRRAASRDRADVRPLARCDRADAGILFYYFLLSTAMAMPIAALDWQPFEARAWIYLLGIGFAQLLSQVFIVRAYRYASSVKKKKKHAKKPNLIFIFILYINIFNN